jgi:hypothetical protein
VYIKENLAPPTSLAQVTTAYATAWSKATNPSYWSKLYSSGGWKTFGVYVSRAKPSLSLCWGPVSLAVNLAAPALVCVQAPKRCASVGPASAPRAE